MTIEEAEARIQAIEDANEDDEVAHGLEDEMLWDYVKARAAGGDTVAKVLLRSLEIDFHRWAA